MSEQEVSRRDLFRVGFGAGAGLLAAAVLPGCDVSAPQRTPATRAAEIENLGNGVYVLPAREFDQTLLEFRQQRPDVRITALSTGDDGKYGAHNFVVVTDEPATTRNTVMKDYQQERYDDIKHLGNGLYDFPASYFAENLAKWRGENQDLTIEAITSNRDGQYGAHDFIVLTSKVDK